MVALGLSSLEAEENKSDVRLHRTHQVAFYQIDLDSDTLKELAKFCGHGSSIHSIVWEDSEVLEGQTSNVLITADSETVKVWDVESTKTTGTITADKLATA